MKILFNCCKNTGHNVTGTWISNLYINGKIIINLWVDSVQRTFSWQVTIFEFEKAPDSTERYYQTRWFPVYVPPTATTTSTVKGIFLRTLRSDLIQRQCSLSYHSCLCLSTLKLFPDLVIEIRTAGLNNASWTPCLKEANQHFSDRKNRLSWLTRNLQDVN